MGKVLQKNQRLAKRAASTRVSAGVGKPVPLDGSLSVGVPQGSASPSVASCDFDANACTTCTKSSADVPKKDFRTVVNLTYGDEQGPSVSVGGQASPEEGRPHPRAVASRTHSIILKVGPSCADAVPPGRFVGSVSRVNVVNAPGRVLLQLKVDDDGDQGDGCPSREANRDLGEGQPHLVVHNASVIPVNVVGPSASPSPDSVSRPGTPGSKPEEGTRETFFFGRGYNTSDYSPSSRGSSLSSSSSRPNVSHDSDYYCSSSEEEDRETKGPAVEPPEDPADKMSPLAKVRMYRSFRRLLRHTHPSMAKEYDLEQRIALEIKMREGATKLLQACGARGTSQSKLDQPHTLEAAKTLLTSNERMTAYMAELQQRRITSRRKGDDSNRPESSLARVCLSDLRMPLLWKDIEHFRNRGDNRRYAVFVLVKIGTEIYDTVMVNPVDTSMMDICFDDIIVFNGIPPNFEFTLEVYSHLMESQSMSSIPRKLQRTIHSSISRTVGRKLAASLRDELSTDLGPKFDLVASAKLNINDLSNNISTYDLILENTENRYHQLPLFGHFCCRLAAQPECSVQERISGYAQVKESEHEKSWCRVFGWRLEVWGSKEEAHISPHHPLALSIDKTTEIVEPNPTTLILRNTGGLDRGQVTMAFKKEEDAKSWSKAVREHVLDHKLWGKAAEVEMEMLTPQPMRHSFIQLPRRERFTSLYEETPMIDGSPSSEKSSYDDLYGSSSSSYCPPSSFATPARGFTLSSRNSFRRWGSMRTSMPFFKTKS